MAVKPSDVKGKSIIIVGSSNKIVGGHLGSYIDAFDYVVKFNGSLFLHDKEDFIRDYGSRDNFHFLTNPFVREVNPNLDKYPFVDCFLFKKDYPKYKHLNRVIIGQSFREVQEGMKKPSYSGVAVLYFILKYNPSFVQLIGWDMYVNKPNYWDGDWSHYPEGYIPQEMKDLTAVENADGRLGHSRYWNAVVLKRLILKHKVVHDKQLWDNIEYIIANRESYE